jgi:histidinol-phosphatase (PHP family)
MISKNANDVAVGRVLFESHCHTPLCKHAVGMPQDYAARAWEAGLAGIIFTCHCPLPDGICSEVRMSPKEFPRYVEMVQVAAQNWAGRLDVRLGLESDYFPGFEGWLEKLHNSAELHHVLGSVHHHMRYYRERYETGSIEDFYRTYFELLARSAESGLFDTLAHPDLVKNELPEHWSFELVRNDVARALDRISKTGVAMELNTSGRFKALPEMNPSREQLRMMCERSIPVVLGSDAHSPYRVGDHFAEALRILAEVGYQEVCHFIKRKPVKVKISDALASLEMR